MSDILRVPASRRSKQAADRDDIEFHYDVGNEFFRVWLDTNLNYSAAMWPGVDTLEEAQSKKNRFHLSSVDVENAARILDVGCGWGALLSTAAEMAPAAKLVGLTLSGAQREHCEGLLPEADIRLESWENHSPAEPYDAITVVGALEHFVHHEMSQGERIKRYGEFFNFCRKSLRANGRLSLQTIGYGNLPQGKLDPFIYEQIFPNSDLPFLEELVEASRASLEIRSVRNDRLDYARTCAEWALRLTNRRDEAASVVGNAGLVSSYIRYLKMSAAGFRSGALNLYRILFTPYPEPRSKG